jgi:hemoglobin/transferrin/lactoferrin receptor protein
MPIRSRHALSSLLAGAVLLPAAAFAADAPAADAQATATDLSVITVTATRTPLSLLEAPATVTVFDAEAIADLLATDLRELIRFEPGVTVRRAPARFGAAIGSSGRDGNAGFNIRGLEGNRVLILVDGVRVPEGFEFGAQAAGRGDYVDLGLLKSVEILRGPASALYGSDGLAGVVSFVTSDPEDLLRDKDWGLLARGGYASADREWNGTAIASGRVGALSAMVALTVRRGQELDNQGTNDAPDSTRTRPNPQDTRSDSVLGKLVYDAGGGHRLRLTAEHLDDRVDTQVLSGIAPVPSLPTSVIGLAAEDRIRRSRLSLDWRYAGEGLVESAQLTGHWQEAKNRQAAFEDRRTAPDRSRINTFDNRVWGLAGDVTLGFRTGPAQHRLVTGVDLVVTRQDGVRDGTVPTPPDVFPTRAFPTTDFTLAGLFVGDEIRLADGRVILFPALRFDHYSLRPRDDALLPGFRSARSSGSRVSPKLGATFLVTQGVSLVANYAQGFKAPSPSQVNQFFENLTSPFFAYTSLQNPDLGPETSESLEAGLRVSNGPVQAALTAFTGRYRDFINQEPISGTGTIRDPILFQFINLEKVDISGVEARFAVKPVEGVTIDGAMAWARGRVEREGVRTPLLTIEPLRFVGGIGYRAPDDRFGGQLIATIATQKERRETAGLCTPACLVPDGYAVLDATAFIRLNETFILRAGLFNILDAAYADWADIRGLADTAANRAVADAWTQAGRNLSVTLTARF